MLDVFAAYLAGIIDGEGTITIHQHIQHNRPTWQLRPRLIVGNTNKLLVDTLQHRHGGSVVLHQRREPARRDFFIWRICAGPEIYAILKEARPHLVIKAALADLMLRYLELRAQSQALSPRAPYTDQQVAIFKKIEEINSWRAGRQLSRVVDTARRM